MKDQCPACQASFRGVRVCPRCGADLGRLMQLSADSWRSRQAAREALGVWDISRASALAAEAEMLRSTEAGRTLLVLCEWLGAKSPTPRF